VIYPYIILASGELKSKIGLLISFTLEYSIRIDSAIDILNVTKDLFITDLTTLFSILLKLSIKLTFKDRFLKESIFLTILIQTFWLSNNLLFICNLLTQHRLSYFQSTSSVSTREAFVGAIFLLSLGCLKVVDCSQLVLSSVEISMS
jgi:hypothetical protein